MKLKEWEGDMVLQKKMWWMALATIILGCGLAGEGQAAPSAGGPVTPQVAPNRAATETKLLLMSHPRTFLRAIQVRMAGSDLVLEGEVADAAEQATAKEIATYAAPGVRVVDRLTVRQELPGYQPALADERVLAEVQGVVQRRFAPVAANLNVSVRDGVVVVEGLVKDQEAKLQLSTELRQAGELRPVRNLCFVAEGGTATAPAVPAAAAAPQAGEEFYLPIRAPFFRMDMRGGPNGEGRLDIAAPFTRVTIGGNRGSRRARRAAAERAPAAPATTEGGGQSLAAEAAKAYPGLRYRAASGVVFLSGSVPTPADRVRVVAMAYSAAGVRGVVDQMSVADPQGKPAPERPSDLGPYLRQVLAAGAGLTGLQVKLEIDRVVVSGAAPTEQHREWARKAIERDPSLGQLQVDLNLRLSG